MACFAPRSTAVMAWGRIVTMQQLMGLWPPPGGTVPGRRTLRRPEHPHFHRRQRAPLTDLQAADRDRTDLHADQLEHRRVQGLNHAADLAISPFGQRDLQVRVPLRNRGRAGTWRGPRRSVGQLHTVTQPLQLFVRQPLRRFHGLRFRHVRFGVGDAFRQLVVVRHKQQPGRIEIETPDQGRRTSQGRQ